MGKWYYLNDNGEYTPTDDGGSITITSIPDPKQIGKKIISGQITKIILLGDSSTDGEGGSGYVASESLAKSINTNGYCWANLLKKFLSNRHGVQVENYGYRGSAAGYQVEQILPVLTKDTFVFWLSGANNRVSEALYNEYDTNIATYIKQVADASAGLLMMTNAPTTESADSWVRFKTSDMRDVLVRNCPSDVLLLDMHDAYIDRCRAKGITVDSTMSDFYHCNDDGYEMMFHIIMDAIGIPTNPYTDYSSSGDWWNGMELLINTGLDEKRIQDTIQLYEKDDNVWDYWDTQVPFVMFCDTHMAADGTRATRFSSQTLRQIRFGGVGMVAGSLTIGTVELTTYKQGYPTLVNPVTVQMTDDGIIDFGENGYNIPAGHTLAIGQPTDSARLCVVEDSMLSAMNIALIPEMWKTGEIYYVAPCAAFYKKC